MKKPILISTLCSMIFIIVALFCFCCLNKYSPRNNDTLIHSQIIQEQLINDSDIQIIVERVFVQTINSEKNFRTVNDTITFSKYLPYTYDYYHGDGMAYIRKMLMEGYSDVNNLPNTLK